MRRVVKGLKLDKSVGCEVLSEDMYMYMYSVQGYTFTSVTGFGRNSGRKRLIIMTFAEYISSPLV